MRYFEGLTEEGEIRKRYRELSKLYHPDLGGCAETMKLINLQYEQVSSGLYQRLGKSISEMEELLKRDKRVAEALYAINALEGLEIEICGSWLWVSGTTREHNSKLKESGFYWASKKRMWYWHVPEDRKRRRGSLSMEAIREKYGSSILKSTGRAKIG